MHNPSKVSECYPSRITRHASGSKTHRRIAPGRPAKGKTFAAFGAGRNLAANAQAANAQAALTCGRVRSRKLRYINTGKSCKNYMKLLQISIDSLKNV